MNQAEILKWAGKGLQVAINLLIATIGVRATKDLILDPIREAMVRDQRGPTDLELDTIMTQIQANSDIIQGTGTPE